MNKPNNYENTQTGEYIPVDIGGHYAVIKGVKERNTKNGDPMIVVALDFDSHDIQPAYFQKAFDNDTRDDKKWPNQGTNYITTEYAGKCTKGFKSFLKAFADSNGIDVETGIKWGDDFCKQFMKKKIGVVFGEEEQLYNGEIKVRRVIRWYCEYDKVKSQKIPDTKLYKGDRPAAAPTQKNDDFMSIPDSDPDEVPFD